MAFKINVSIETRTSKAGDEYRVLVLHFGDFKKYVFLQYAEWAFLDFYLKQSEK